VASSFTLALVLALSLGAGGCRNLTAPPSRLLLSPASMSFTAVAGGQNPPSQFLTISQTGTAVRPWVASVDVTWLAVAPTGDALPDFLTVAATPAGAGLGSGSYHGTITVSAPGGEAPWAAVPVTLTLTTMPSLTGRWMAISAAVNVALNLTEQSGVVTGTGSLTGPARPVVVAGTHAHPAVSLTLLSAASDTTRLAGSFATDNSVAGSLNGPGLPGVAVTLVRQ